MSTQEIVCDGESLTHAGNAGNEAAEAAAGSTRVARRRSEALRGFFPLLALWFSNHIHFSRMREVEEYLAQATDLADLEIRIAKIERGAVTH